MKRVTHPFFRPGFPRWNFEEPIESTSWQTVDKVVFTVPDLALHVGLDAKSRIHAGSVAVAVQPAVPRRVLDGGQSIARHRSHACGFVVAGLPSWLLTVVLVF